MHILKPTVLVIQLQQDEYQTPEQTNLEVCFDVLSGVLDFDITQAVSLVSSNGIAQGNHTNVKLKDKIID